MEHEALWAELTRVAQRLGVELRVERLTPDLESREPGRGGLCVLRGRRVILVDERAPLHDRVVTMAVALGRFDLEGIHLAPLVRSTIERRGRPAPPRPGARRDATRVPAPAGSSWVRIGTATAANDEHLG